MSEREQSPRETDGGGNSVGGSCPDCGGPTTQKGITVTGGPWDGSGDTWESCLNCDWSRKEGDS